MYLNRWCHPPISSSVALFSFYLQSFPASGSFPMSQLFILGGQSIRTEVSALASVLPKSIQGWFPLRLTGLIYLLAFQATLTVYQISSQNIMKKQWSRIGRQTGGVYWTLEIKNIPHREKDRTSLFECEKLSWFQKLWNFPDGSDGKESACNEGEVGLIPGLRRSPGEENGNSGVEPSSPASPALAGGSFTTEPPGKPHDIKYRVKIYI